MMNLSLAQQCCSSLVLHFKGSALNLAQERGFLIILSLALSFKKERELHCEVYEGT
jgi:hypothetical protein